MLNLSKNRTVNDNDDRLYRYVYITIIVVKFIAEFRITEESFIYS